MNPRDFCARCGTPVNNEANRPFMLCNRCEADQAYQRMRRYKRESRRCQLARVRAWRRGVKGKYYPADVERLRRRQGNRCLYCDADLTETGTHVEHQVPLSRCKKMGIERGNSLASGNLVLSCPQCNRDKGTRTHEEFLEVLSND